MTDITKARYIEVEAEVRYWEDATVNDVADDDGTLIPFRDYDCWCPVIDLIDGRVKYWPEGMEVSTYYKVCDQGVYWLLDDNGNRIAKWKGYYVPDEFLCHGDNGYGDYIILDIDGYGGIANYAAPDIDPDQWAAL